MIAGKHILFKIVYLIGDKVVIRPISFIDLDGAVQHSFVCHKKYYSDLTGSEESDVKYSYVLQQNFTT